MGIVRHCFTIDDKKLYMEHKIVELDHIPSLYTCVDMNSTTHYLVELVDGKDVYYVFELSDESYRALMTANKPIRDILLGCKYVYDVTTTSNDIDDDIVRLLPIREVDVSVLPIEGTTMI